MVEPAESVRLLPLLVLFPDSCSALQSTGDACSGKWKRRKRKERQPGFNDGGSSQACSVFFPFCRQTRREHGQGTKYLPSAGASCRKVRGKAAAQAQDDVFAGQQPKHSALQQRHTKHHRELQVETALKEWSSPNLWAISSVGYRSCCPLASWQPHAPAPCAM